MKESYVTGESCQKNIEDKLRGLPPAQKRDNLVSIKKNNDCNGLKCKKQIC